MNTWIQLGDTPIEVVLKNIKNVHLSVYPPTGAVRISAPLRMRLDTIRTFAISKLPWIKKQQKKIQSQERETPRDYVDRESHYLWGKRYLLKVIESDRRPMVLLRPSQMLLYIDLGANREAKKELMETWYRKQIKKAVLRLLDKWESLIGVKVERVFVQRMKTKWGSCNAYKGSIRLNTDLAKKPPECLEYIVVHEMVHLLERSHNTRFIGLMDRFMPQWRIYRNQLNQLPVRHEEWTY